MWGQKILEIKNDTDHPYIKNKYIYNKSKDHSKRHSSKNIKFLY